MEACSFEESNIVFDKPNDMTREQCNALSCFRGPTTEGDIVTISCFKCTKEELEEINKTGRVWVYHFGTYLQPHSVSGTNPFRS